MNILISSAGRRVSLLQAFKTEAAKFNGDIKIFACDHVPELSSACRISDGFFKVSKVNSENYIEELLAICKENKITIIVPTIDTELILLSKNREVFLQHDIHVIVSDFPLIEIYHNKRLTKKFFTENDINTSIEYTRQNYKFPLFIKPEDGSRSQGIHIIKSEEEMKPAFFMDERLMFLEYIDHNIYQEYTIDLYYDRNSRLKCIIPRLRIEVRDGEVNKAVTRRENFVAEFWQKLNYLEGARGVITLQIFKHKQEDKIFGIEVNPRFSGGYPLAYLAGGNFPNWLIREYIYGEEIQEFDEWEENLLMLRYDSEILVRNYE